MTEAKQKKGVTFLSNKYLKSAFAVPKHDVLVIILKQSYQCFHSIG